MLINRCYTSESCWKTLNVWNLNFTETEKEKMKNLATLIVKMEGRKVTQKDLLTPMVEDLKVENSLSSRLIRFKWLKFDQANSTLSLGPRFIGQMKPWIQETLQERIVCACGEMVLRGSFCDCGLTGCHYNCDNTGLSKCLTCEKALPTAPNQKSPSETGKRKSVSVTSPSKKKARTESYFTTSPQLVGLHNLGNTCYLNAVLQCLSHTNLGNYISLCDEILLGVLGKEWKKLLHNLKNSGKNSISPIEVLKEVRKEHPPFQTPGQQEDAHEMLKVFLDQLHQEFRTSWPDNTSPVTEHFTSTMNIDYKCRKCDYQQPTRRENFQDWSLFKTRFWPEAAADIHLSSSTPSSISSRTAGWEVQ